ncbi:MAG: methylenetetrahydrofolate reductase, partial [Desulfobacteraceae bacterium]|nr:methylenetetrahydrofolate reductase [Desulfobacteraceae bacterium]
MLRIFSDEISNSKNFVVTLELVPGRESAGRNIDTLKGIARDAFGDGRISAVSITDNPGGNPSLSPDVLGYEIFKYGLDVIVHFTCRDLNRVGMESRALQLARMGMKNILALTGDYSGKGFGGQGKPVFDFDSVILTTLLKSLDQRLLASGDPDLFFTGCAVSPFKTTRAETLAQYGKLDKKLAAGASFVITQLGYDVEKFRELITQLHQKKMNPPVMGSVYLLSPRSAR